MNALQPLTLPRPQTPRIQTAYIPNLIMRSFKQLYDEKALASYAAYRQSTIPTTAFDPLLNKRAREEYYRQYEQTALTELGGRLLGTAAGAGLGYGIGATIGSIIGGTIGYFAGGVGVVPGAKIGAGIGGKIGATIGGTYGLATSDYTTFHSTMELVDRTIIETFRNPGRGLLNSLMLIGNTGDQYTGAMALKATLSAGIAGENVWEHVTRAYGAHEEGFEDYSFGRIRGQLGIDTKDVFGKFGGVTNFILDMVGEQFLDLGGIGKKIARSSAKSASTGIVDDIADAANVVESPTKKVAKTLTDNINKHKEAMDKYGTSAYRKWQANISHKRYVDRITRAFLEKDETALQRMILNSGVRDIKQEHISALVNQIHQTASTRVSTHLFSLGRTFEEIDQTITNIMFKSTTPGWTVATLKRLKKLDDQHTRFLRTVKDFMFNTKEINSLVELGTFATKKEASDFMSLKDKEAIVRKEIIDNRILKVETAKVFGGLDEEGKSIFLRIKDTYLKKRARLTSAEEVKQLDLEYETIRKKLYEFLELDQSVELPDDELFEIIKEHNAKITHTDTKYENIVKHVIDKKYGKQLNTIRKALDRVEVLIAAYPTAGQELWKQKHREELALAIQEITSVLIHPDAKEDLLMYFANSRYKNLLEYIKDRIDDEQLKILHEEVSDMIPRSLEAMEAYTDEELHQLYRYGEFINKITPEYDPNKPNKPYLPKIELDHLMNRVDLRDKVVRDTNHHNAHIAIKDAILNTLLEDPKIQKVIKELELDDRELQLIHEIYKNVEGYDKNKGWIMLRSAFHDRSSFTVRQRQIIKSLERVVQETFSNQVVQGDIPENIDKYASYIDNLVSGGFQDFQEMSKADMADLVTRINADISQMSHLKDTVYYKNVVKLRDELLAQQQATPIGHLKGETTMYSLFSKFFYRRGMSSIEDFTNNMDDLKRIIQKQLSGIDVTEDTMKDIVKLKTLHTLMETRAIKATLQKQYKALIDYLVGGTLTKREFGDTLEKILYTTAYDHLTTGHISMEELKMLMNEIVEFEKRIISGDLKDTESFETFLSELKNKVAVQGWEELMETFKNRANIISNYIDAVDRQIEAMLTKFTEDYTKILFNFGKYPTAQTDLAKIDFEKDNVFEQLVKSKYTDDEITKAYDGLVAKDVAKVRQKLKAKGQLAAEVHRINTTSKDLLTEKFFKYTQEVDPSIVIEEVMEEELLNSLYSAWYDGDSFDNKLKEFYKYEKAVHELRQAKKDLERVENRSTTKLSKHKVDEAITELQGLQEDFKDSFQDLKIVPGLQPLVDEIIEYKIDGLNTAEDFTELISDVKVDYSSDGVIIDELVAGHRLETSVAQFINGVITLDEFKFKLQAYYPNTASVPTPFEAAFEDYLISNLSNWLVRDVISTGRYIEILDNYSFVSIPQELIDDTMAAIIGIKARQKAIFDWEFDNRNAVEIFKFSEEDVAKAQKQVAKAEEYVKGLQKGFEEDLTDFLDKVFHTTSATISEKSDSITRLIYEKTQELLDSLRDPNFGFQNLEPSNAIRILETLKIYKNEVTKLINFGHRFHILKYSQAGGYMMNQSLRNLLDMNAIFFNEETLKVEMISREELAKLLPADDVDYAMQVIEDIYEALHKGSFAQFEHAVKQSFQTSFKPIQKASEVAELTGVGKALQAFERTSRTNDALLRKKAKETGVNLLLSNSDIVLSDTRRIYVDTETSAQFFGNILELSMEDNSGRKLTFYLDIETVPDMQIDKGAARVHGYDVKRLKELKKQAVEGTLGPNVRVGSIQDMLLALDEFAQGGVILGHNFKFDLLTILHNYSKNVLGKPLLPEILDPTTDMKALWNNLTVEQFNDILRSMQIDGKPILVGANIVDTESFLKAYHILVNEAIDTVQTSNVMGAAKVGAIGFLRENSHGVLIDYNGVPVSSVQEYMDSEGFEDLVIQRFVRGKEEMYLVNRDSLAEQLIHNAANDVYINKRMMEKMLENPLLKGRTLGELGDVDKIIDIKSIIKEPKVLEELPTYLENIKNHIKLNLESMNVSDRYLSGAFDEVAILTALEKVNDELFDKEAGDFKNIGDLSYEELSNLLEETEELERALKNSELYKNNKVEAHAGEKAPDTVEGVTPIIIASKYSKKTAQLARRKVAAKYALDEAWEKYQELLKEVKEKYKRPPQKVREEIYRRYEELAPLRERLKNLEEELAKYDELRDAERLEKYQSKGGPSTSTTDIPLDDQGMLGATDFIEEFNSNIQSALIKIDNQYAKLFPDLGRLQMNTTAASVMINYAFLNNQALKTFEWIFTGYEGGLESAGGNNIHQLFHDAYNWEIPEDYPIKEYRGMKIRDIPEIKELGDRLREVRIGVETYDNEINQIYEAIKHLRLEDANKNPIDVTKNNAIDILHRMYDYVNSTLDTFVYRNMPDKLAPRIREKLRELAGTFFYEKDKGSGTEFVDSNQGLQIFDEIIDAITERAIEAHKMGKTSVVFRLDTKLSNELYHELNSKFTYIMKNIFPEADGATHGPEFYKAAGELELDEIADDVSRTASSRKSTGSTNKSYQIRREVRHSAEQLFGEAIDLLREPNRVVKETNKELMKRGIIRKSDIQRMTGLYTHELIASNELYAFVGFDQLRQSQKQKQQIYELFEGITKSGRVDPGEYIEAAKNKVGQIYTELSHILGVKMEHLLQNTNRTKINNHYARYLNSLFDEILANPEKFSEFLPMHRIQVINDMINVLEMDYVTNMPELQRRIKQSVIMNILDFDGVMEAGENKQFKEGISEVLKAPKVFDSGTEVYIKSMMDAGTYEMTRNVLNMFTNVSTGQMDYEALTSFLKDNSDLRLVIQLPKEGTEGVLRQIDINDQALLRQVIENRDNYNLTVMGYDDFVNITNNIEPVEIPKALEIFRKVLVTPFKVLGLFNLNYLINNFIEIPVKNYMESGEVITSLADYAFASKQYFQYQNLYWKVTGDPEVWKKYGDLEVLDQLWIDELIQNWDKYMKKPFNQNIIDDLRHFQEFSKAQASSFEMSTEFNRNMKLSADKEKYYRELETKVKSGKGLTDKEDRDWYIINREPTEGFKSLEDELAYLEETVENGQALKREYRRYYNLKFNKDGLDKNLRQMYGFFNMLGMQKMLNVSSSLETIGRFSLYNRNIMQGASKSEAAKRLADYFFIYSNKSAAVMYAETMIPFLLYPIKTANLMYNLLQDHNVMEMVTNFTKYSWGNREFEDSDYLVNRKMKGDLLLSDTTALSAGLPFYDGLNASASPLQSAFNKMHPALKPIMDLATDAEYNRWTGIPVISQGRAIQQVYQGIESGGLQTKPINTLFPSVTNEFFKQQKYNQNIRRIYPRNNYKNLYTKSGHSRVQMRMSKTTSKNLPFRVNDIMYMFKNRHGY